MRLPPIPRLTPAVLAALTLLLTLASGAAPARAEEGRPFNLVSGYLDEPVLGGRVVTLEGFLDRAGVIELDPRRCQLDEFGDVTTCTRMAARRLEVQLRRVKLDDPRGHGRALYLLSGLPREEGPSAGPKLFLVAPPQGSPDAWRLVVDGGDAGRRVVLLESRPPRPGGAPRPPTPEPAPDEDLCAEATYSATWSDGVVTIEASVNAPTPGHDVRLEQSPLRIWPPQHRLLCVPPDGMVIQVITPRVATATFKADEAPREVVVHDRRGPQRIPVRTR